MKKRTVVAVLLALFVLAGGASAQDWSGTSTQNAYNDLSFASDLVGAGITISGTAYKIVGGPTQSVLGAGSNARCVWMNPGDVNTIWVGLAYPARMAKSTNGGTSWVSVTMVYAGGGRPNSGVYQIYSAGGTMLACGDSNLNSLSGQHGFVARSTDGGSSWSTALTGFEKLNSVVGLSASNWLIFGEAGGNYQSTNGGVSFTSAGNALVLRYTRATVFGTDVYVAGRTSTTTSPTNIYIMLDYLQEKYGLSAARAMLEGKLEEPNSILALSKAMVQKYTVAGFVETTFTDAEAYTSSGFDIAISNIGGPVFELATQRMLLQGGNSLPYIMKSAGGLTWAASYTGATNAQQVLCIERPAVSQAYAGGPFGLIWTTSALPIQLAVFTAFRAATAVRLNWTTLSEVNNYAFYVMRRVGAEVDFMQLPNAFIPGNGTTNQPHHYEFLDEAAPTTGVYYRLKQVDLDGSFHMSGEIHVDALTGVSEAQPLQFSLAQNYPNPFNPVTTLTYTVANQTHVVLTITNALGEEVATLVNEQLQAGKYSAQFNAANMPSGIYIYRLRAGDFVETKKMLLLK